MNGRGRGLQVSTLVQVSAFSLQVVLATALIWMYRHSTYWPHAVLLVTALIGLLVSILQANRSQPAYTGPVSTVGAAREHHERDGIPVIVWLAADTTIAPLVKTLGHRVQNVLWVDASDNALAERWVRQSTGEYRLPTVFLPDGPLVNPEPDVVVAALDELTVSRAGRTPVTPAGPGPA